MYIDEVLADQVLEYRALFRQLADDVAPLDRVHVAIGAGDVDVAADDELFAFGVDALRPVGEGAQEGELRRIVFAAVRYVDRSEDGVAELAGDDARLHVEGWMREGRLLSSILEVQRHARISLHRRAVPVDVIVGDAALERHLVDVRLQLLQAEDVGPFLLQELAHLPGAGADAVHVPGGDLHKQFGDGARTSWGSVPEFK